MLELCLLLSSAPRDCRRRQSFSAPWVSNTTASCTRGGRNTLRFFLLRYTRDDMTRYFTSPTQYILTRTYHQRKVKQAGRGRKRPAGRSHHTAPTDAFPPHHTRAEESCAQQPPLQHSPVSRRFVLWQEYRLWQQHTLPRDPSHQYPAPFCYRGTEGHADKMALGMETQRKQRGIT